MLFLSRCTHCNYRLLMLGTKQYNEYSCSKCIPRNSSARDNINETYKYELLRWKIKN